MKIILDTNVIIEALENNSMRELFNKIAADGDQIWITFDVYLELKDKISNNESIELEALIREGIPAGHVVHSRRKFILKKHYKKLSEYLQGSSIRLQRTDRNLIALAVQIEGSIMTRDTGIMDAIDALKYNNTKWREMARDRLNPGYVLNDQNTS